MLKRTVKHITFTLAWFGILVLAYFVLKAMWDYNQFFVENLMKYGI